MDSRNFEVAHICHLIEEKQRELDRLYMLLSTTASVTSGHETDQCNYVMPLGLKLNVEELQEQLIRAFDVTDGTRVSISQMDECSKSKVDTHRFVTSECPVTAKRPSSDKRVYVTSLNRSDGTTRRVYTYQFK